MSTRRNAVSVLVDKVQPRFRIIYQKRPMDPCPWLIQERVCLFFWADRASYSSIAHAGNDVLNTMAGRPELGCQKYLGRS
jgi:hypothetical protein